MAASREPRPEAPLRWPVLVLRGLAGACLGLTVGLGALVWHSHWWGLALAGAATASTAALLGPGARAGFVVGWWVPVLRGALPTGAGDLLVMGDLPGYALLLGGFVLAIGTMVAASGSRTPRPASGDHGILRGSA